LRSVASRRVASSSPIVGFAWASSLCSSFADLSLRSRRIVPTLRVVGLSRVPSWYSPACELHTITVGPSRFLTSEPLYLAVAQPPVLQRLLQRLNLQSLSGKLSLKLQPESLALAPSPETSLSLGSASLSSPGFVRHSTDTPVKMFFASASPQRASSLPACAATAVSATALSISKQN